MKKVIKIVLLALSIIILLALLHPVSPLRSAYSKYVLMSNPVLEDFNADCKYYKPTMFLGPTNPALSCLTEGRFDEEGQRNEIKRIGVALGVKGWTFPSSENFHDRDVTYYKDDMRINIKPYDWEPDRADTEPKLIINLQHVTQIDYRDR